MYNYEKQVSFDTLVGKVITKIEGLSNGSGEVKFITEDGNTFTQEHFQDCCESVSVEDVAGDLEDLIGSPILFADERTSSDPEPGQRVESYDSFTWTFYRIGTAKGTVVIRWYGSSNGYYSERASFWAEKPVDVPVTNVDFS
jgi:hypothetical protein